VSFLGRRREACRRKLRGTDSSPSPERQGTRARSGAHGGRLPHPGVAGARAGLGAPKHVNSAWISGVIADDPVHDIGRDGRPVKLLLVAFPAPDPVEEDEAASTELEVPVLLLEKYGKEPIRGQEVFAVGRLSGGGGVFVSELHLGPMPEPNVEK